MTDTEKQIREKQNQARTKLKAKCGADIEALHKCKKDHPSDYKTACPGAAITVANCAAENFCHLQLIALRENCLVKGQYNLCQTAKHNLDKCFVDQGFPIRPPAK